MVTDPIDFALIKRALVIKLRHHGDVLLTSPVFQVLKNHAPHVEIDALVYHETREMLTEHPAISTVHTIDRTWKADGLIAQATGEWKLLRALRSRRYDLIVHLTDHPRGAWLSRLLRPRYSVSQRFRDGDGEKSVRLWQKSFSHLFLLPQFTHRHTVETNLDAIRRLGVNPSQAERRLVLVPGTAAEQKVDALLATHNLTPKQFIHLHPTSRWFFKTWPAEKFAELIVELGRNGQRVVLTAAPSKEERDRIAAIKNLVKAPIVDFTGMLSLKELAALAARARAFVGVDSAPMHMAAAMQTPVVAIFGPSNETLWGPWEVRHRIAASIQPEHRCRPCGNAGCGGSERSECVEMLPVSSVQAALNDLLATA